MSVWLYLLIVFVLAWVVVACFVLAKAVQGLRDAVRDATTVLLEAEEEARRTRHAVEGLRRVR